MKIVLDTNVLLAAYASQGLCAEILEWCLRKHVLVFSPFILAEFKDKLTGKFHFPVHQAKQLIIDLKKECVLVDDRPLHVPHLRDKTDAPIVAAALAANADIIVSGDKDLLDLGAYRYIKILSPRQFVQRYL